MVCLYKLRAARFHYENIESAYHAVKPAMFEWTKNFSSPTPQEVMPIYISLDTFLYQLVSCFDMLLQVVNIRSGVGLPVEQVMWKAGVNSRTTTRIHETVEDE